MNPWRVRWTGRQLPNLVQGEISVSGTALAVGAERWTRAFRAIGLVPGDRVATVLPSGGCLVQVLLAGLWEGLTLVPLPPGTDSVVVAALADPALVIGGPGPFGLGEVDWAWTAEGSDGPGQPPVQLRPTGPRSPSARLLCPSSGGGPWTALVDDNLAHAVDAVVAAVPPHQARWLSVLPWYTPAGLLLDLLPALLGAHDIIRLCGQDAVSAVLVADAIQARQPSHTVLPISLVRELREHWGGLAPFGGFQDGLATGPGLTAELAADLRRTRLRSQRGAPELSCMVTLGEPGMWRMGALGRPVGCTIAEGPGGSLLVTGRAVAGGRWVDGIVQTVDRSAPVIVNLT